MSKSQATFESNNIKFDNIQSIQFNPSGNFQIWKYKFMTLAETLNVDEAFDLSCKDNEKKKKLKTMLIFSLDETTLSLITAGVLTKNPAEIWSNLLELFESDTIATRTVTRANFLQMKMVEGENMKVYVSRLLNMADKLTALNEPPSENDKLFVFFNGLSKEYRSFAYSLEVQPGMTFQLAAKHLIAHYERMKINGELNDGLNGELHFTQQFKSKRRLWCSNCKMDNHTNSTCRKPNRNKVNDTRKTSNLTFS